MVLKEKSLVLPPHQYRKFEPNGFRTMSRKVELYSRVLELMGYDPLPSYQEPPESPVSQPKTARKYPYILTTGSRRREYFHSEQRYLEPFRRKNPDPLADIHPETAKRHGIEHGDWIYVRSPRGQIKMKASLDTDIRSDVVNIDHGWWFPEKEASDMFGVWESNANMLTSNEPPYDPAFGTYQLTALLCSIEKIKEEELT